MDESGQIYFAPEGEIYEDDEARYKFLLGEEAGKIAYKNALDTVAYAQMIYEKLGRRAKNAENR